MDCRRALEILEFSDRESDGAAADFCSPEDRAAAEEHLEGCAACAQAVGNWRQLDRTIGQVMRAVPIPRGAQQRLFARLAEVEPGKGAEAIGAEPNLDHDEQVRP